MAFAAAAAGASSFGSSNNASFSHNTSFGRGGGGGGGGGYLGIDNYSFGKSASSANLSRSMSSRPDIKSSKNSSRAPSMRQQPFGEDEYINNNNNNSGGTTAGGIIGLGGLAGSGENIDQLLLQQQSPPSPTQQQQQVQQQEQKEEKLPTVQVSELELENIRRIFKQFDADGSNSIDVEELSLIMTSLGVQMDEEQLKLLVEQVTSEGEQELSFEEFVSLITLWKEAAQYKLFEGDGFKSLAKQHVDAALEAKSHIPDSKWRTVWDVAVCVVAVLYWIFVLLLDAYTIDGFDVTGLIVGDVLCTVFLIADIYICARTAYSDNGRLIDDESSVFDRYRRTWLIPDILASLPLDLILTAAGAPSAVATGFRHLRLLKLIKVPMLFRSSDVVPMTSGYITMHFHMLPILQLIITFVILTHGFAIGWVILKQNNCDHRDKVLMAKCIYPYTPAIYFILYSLSGVGLGDIRIDGTSEYAFTCCLLVGAMASNGIVIGKLVQILQRADIKKEQRSKIRETLAVLEHYHIATQLQTEILQFQAHVFENNLGAAYESIVSDLPAEMRTNISLFVRMKLVSVVPLFQESHFMLRIAVAQSLTNAVARPEQYMCVANQQLPGLHFLAYGFADTFDERGHYRQTLRSGDFFGDESLVGSGLASDSVKALTYCDLWILECDTFEGLLERFPKFKRTVGLLRSMFEEKAQASLALQEKKKKEEEEEKEAKNHHDEDYDDDDDEGGKNKKDKKKQQKKEKKKKKDGDETDSLKGDEDDDERKKRSTPAFGEEVSTGAESPIQLGHPETTIVIDDGITLEKEKAQQHQQHQQQAQPEQQDQAEQAATGVGQQLQFSMSAIEQVNSTGDALNESDGDNHNDDDDDESSSEEDEDDEEEEDQSSAELNSRDVERFLRQIKQFRERLDK